eukprot:TRINITY_DN20274_c0_g1_i1.p1 TRINITY_DN20274_c0_g1~~TRINITY_DN20274_c0_g1_i1.p1  ORF type:complete len:1353 (+),score=459.10 TRINITY_DN20274_c0_g1_i1:40-4059(+)
MASEARRGTPPRPSLPQAKRRTNPQGTGRAQYVEVASRARAVPIYLDGEASGAPMQSAEILADGATQRTSATPPSAPAAPELEPREQVQEGPILTSRDYGSQSTSRERARVANACASQDSIQRADILADAAYDTLQQAVKETTGECTISRIVQVCVRCFLLDVEGPRLAAAKSSGPVASALPLRDDSESDAADEVAPSTAPAREPVLNPFAVGDAGDDPAAREFGDGEPLPQHDFFRADTQLPRPSKQPSSQMSSDGDAVIHKLHKTLHVLTGALEVQHRVLLQLTRGAQAPLPKDHEAKVELDTAFAAINDVRRLFCNAAEAMKDRGDDIQQLRCELNVCREKLLSKEVSQWQERQVFLSHRSVVRWQRKALESMRHRAVQLAAALSSLQAGSAATGPRGRRSVAGSARQSLSAPDPAPRMSLTDAAGAASSTAAEEEQRAAPVAAFLVCCLDSVHRLRALHQKDRSRPVDEALDVWYASLRGCAEMFPGCQLLQPAKLLFGADEDSTEPQAASQPVDAFEAEGYALVAFPTPVAAVQFACALQHMLMALPWPDALLSADHPICPTVFHSPDEAKTTSTAMHTAFHQEFGADKVKDGLAAEFDPRRFDVVTANIIAARDAPPFGIKREGLLFRGPRVRMGIHSGPAPYELSKQGGQPFYYGDTVMKASLLCGKARGGETLLSRDVHQGLKEQFTEAGLWQAPVAVVDPQCVAMDWHRATEDQRALLQSLDCLSDATTAGVTSTLFEKGELACQVLPDLLSHRAAALPEVSDAWEHELCDYNPNWWLRFNNLPPADLQAVAERRARQALMLGVTDASASLGIGGSMLERKLADAVHRLQQQISGLEADYEALRQSKQKDGRSGFSLQMVATLLAAREEEMMAVHDGLSAAGGVGAGRPESGDAGVPAPLSPSELDELMQTQPQMPMLDPALPSPPRWKEDEEQRQHRKEMAVAQARILELEASLQGVGQLEQVQTQLAATEQALDDARVEAAALSSQLEELRRQRDLSDERAASRGATPTPSRHPEGPSTPIPDGPESRASSSAPGSPADMLVMLRKTENLLRQRLRMPTSAAQHWRRLRNSVIRHGRARSAPSSPIGTPVPVGGGTSPVLGEGGWTSGVSAFQTADSTDTAAACLSRIMQLVSTAVRPRGRSPHGSPHGSQHGSPRMSPDRSPSEHSRLASLVDRMRQGTMEQRTEVIKEQWKSRQEVTAQERRAQAELKFLGMSASSSPPSLPTPPPQPVTARRPFHAAPGLESLSIGARQYSTASAASMPTPPREMSAQMAATARGPRGAEEVSRRASGDQAAAAAAFKMARRVTSARASVAPRPPSGRRSLPPRS